MLWIQKNILLSVTASRLRADAEIIANVKDVFHSTYQTRGNTIRRISPESNVYTTSIFVPRSFDHSRFLACLFQYRG